jgi:hypothetical protein
MRVDSQVIYHGRWISALGHLQPSPRRKGMSPLPRKPDARSRPGHHHAKRDMTATGSMVATSREIVGACRAPGKE